MPKIKRPRRQPTEDWQQLQLLCTSPEQVEYEAIRPVVLFGKTAAERARQTGKSTRTLHRRIQNFTNQGMLGLFEQQKSNKPASQHRFPDEMRQFLADLLAQYPHFRPNELAEICDVEFDRRPGKVTLQRVLVELPPPTTTVRRFPLYADIVDAAIRRHAIVQLHLEGWNVKTIAAYLQTSRKNAHSILKRWWIEGVPGLTDKSNAPKSRVGKSDLKTINAVRKLQANPGIGEYRMHTALKRIGIHVSPRTCGRIMQRNRQLYGLSKPAARPRIKKTMPFQAEYRHQFWSVDVRYIEQHQLGGGYVYVISILENYSRVILASAISRSQDLQAYLMVLYSAVRLHGCPQTLVSDSGSIFLAKQAQAIYAKLGIEKRQITRRQPWQNYIETHFSIQHRLADHSFATASDWAAMLQAHEKWVVEYNYQEHWAHRERPDHRHSPAAVLGWARGRLSQDLDLEHTFYALRFGRQLNRLGYVQFRHWQLYGEYGLARQKAAVWLYKETVTIEFDQQPLCQYNTQPDPTKPGQFIVQYQQSFEHNYKSPQLDLWPEGQVEWRRVWQIPCYPRRRRLKLKAIQPALFEVPRTSAKPGALSDGSNLKKFLPIIVARSE